MARSKQATYDRRIGQLKRRRDFLDKRIINYTGKDNSYDKAEAKAIDWAIGIIESNYEVAMDAIEERE